MRSTSSTQPKAGSTTGSTLQFGLTVQEQYGLASLPMLKPGQASAKCVGCKRTLPRRKFPTTAAKGEQVATARRTAECRGCRNLRQGRPSRMAAKASATAKAASAKAAAQAKAKATREAKAAAKAAEAQQVPTSA